MKTVMTEIDNVICYVLDAFLERMDYENKSKHHASKAVEDRALLKQHLGRAQNKTRTRAEAQPKPYAQTRPGPPAAGLRIIEIGVFVKLLV